VKKLIAAGLLGLSLALTPLGGAPAKAAAAAAGWYCADKYCCYGDACKRARYLRQCGYCTCIKCCGGWYYVYYH